MLLELPHLEQKTIRSVLNKDGNNFLKEKLIDVQIRMQNKEAIIFLEKFILSNTLKFDSGKLTANNVNSL